MLSKRLLVLVEDEKQVGKLRCSCAEAVGHSGLKDKAPVERLLHLAEDEKQDGDLRRYCVSAVGNLGFKDKAVDILIDLYLAEADKYSDDAQFIYDSLWNLTAG